jgi:hypothetical protein
MTVVVSRGESPPSIDVVNDGCRFRINHYFGHCLVEGHEPQGFLADITPVEVESGQDEFVAVKPHFHLVRQYQVVVRGNGARIGKSRLGAFDFHYADPSTPYGPICADPEGIAFFTLRPRGETDAHYMPGSRSEMTALRGRNVIIRPDEHEHPEHPEHENPDGRNIVVHAPDGSSSLSVTDVLIDPHDDGLASYRLRLGPGESVVAPSAEGSGGQYVLVSGGNVTYGGERLDELAMLWVAPDDDAPLLTGGEAGGEALVLQFPVRNPAIEPDPA